MKKQKRFLALLLTGLLTIPASIGAGAEELTSEIYYPGQTVTVDDGVAEDSLSDLTSETLPEAEVPVDETSVYEEEIEKMLAENEIKLAEYEEKVAKCERQFDALKQEKDMVLNTHEDDLLN